MSEKGTHIEREIRFLVGSEFEFPRIVLEACTLKESDRQVTDVWYIPSSLTTYAKHEAWLGSGHAAPVRIRIVGGDSESCVMEAKHLEKGSDFSYARESSIEVSDARTADAFLRAVGLARVAITVKIRRLLLHKTGLTLALDSYSSSDLILEVEAAVGSDSGDDAVNLRRWAARALGTGIEELTEPIALRIIRRKLLEVDGSLCSTRHFISDAEFENVLSS